MVEAKNELTRK